MRFIIALLLALGLFTSSATASDPWILVGKTERSAFYMYRGSLGVGTGSDGQRIFYVVGRYTQIGTGESMVQAWYVPVQHCLTGSGKFYATDSEGKQVTDIDFRIGDGTIAASLAKLICNAALNSLTDSKNRI